MELLLHVRSCCAVLLSLQNFWWVFYWTILPNHSCYKHQQTLNTVKRFLIFWISCICYFVNVFKKLSQRRRAYKKSHEASGAQYPRHYVTKLPHQKPGSSNHEAGSCDGKDRLYQNVEDSDVTKLPHQEPGSSNHEAGSWDGKDRLYQNVEDNDDIYDDVEETQTWAQFTIICILYSFLHFVCVFNLL